MAPLTAERFPDLERLFGKAGAVGGCWCMWWRMTPAEFRETSSREHHDALASIAASGRPAGLIAYRGGEPVGWVSVSPRSDLERVELSKRNFRPVDGQPTWAVSCFYVRRGARRSGVASALLRAAVQYAREHGATLVEAYPRDGEAVSDESAFRGTLTMFEREGFQEVARRHPRSPIVRLEL